MSFYKTAWAKFGLGLWHGERRGYFHTHPGAISQAKMAQKGRCKAINVLNDLNERSLVCARLSGSHKWDSTMQNSGWIVALVDF